mmetsp:Transcript_37369/g.97963  ORF Transcript_37369/g.97963 Transcript_37369/m.97963 type:complete len:160 (+) Transcript_37369:268-747(+)|eukprot:CAMPEP_0182917494 /NCGR_PEP_ID=MMETSP0105_2-20130417/1558_1 /TAXON_ID=81532 ORGANISM="Acanthoeca-like sp., Strain 10tr" /NCGR_SAMPLE_ID=MMETSP0105_2 /ASSEMBLY_ACC=CAM_ASM_000205 /LENGTH=159 /DNA_ID=CAMNT_0025054507 /DNA_START=257 /DNA_END=736 /DNA_ORIENTATION=-
MADAAAAGVAASADRKAIIRAKMEARRKAREESGEAAAARQAELDKAKKKEALKQAAALLGGELDALIREEKDKKDVQAKLAAGESAIESNYKLFQTLYPFKSDDPEDLSFEANEIMRVFDWEDEWFEGENQQGQRGYLPKTYLREIKPKGPKAVGGMP